MLFFLDSVDVRQTSALWSPPIASIASASISVAASVLELCLVLQSVTSVGVFRPELVVSTVVLVMLLSYSTGSSPSESC